MKFLIVLLSAVVFLLSGYVSSCDECWKLKPHGKITRKTCPKYKLYADCLNRSQHDCRQFTDIKLKLYCKLENMANLQQKIPFKLRVHRRAVQPGSRIGGMDSRAFPWYEWCSKFPNDDACKCKLPPCGSWNDLDPKPGEKWELCQHWELCQLFPLMKDTHGHMNTVIPKQHMKRGNGSAITRRNGIFYYTDVYFI